jgi:hypothetical protein
MSLRLATVSKWKPWTTPTRSSPWRRTWPRRSGVVPAPRPSGPTITSATYELVGPYRLRSSEVIFVVGAARQRIPVEERDAAWVEFFAEPRACLQPGDLGKRFGWGVHADENGRIALHGLGTPEYESLVAGRTAAGRPAAVIAAMRSRR